MRLFNLIWLVTALLISCKSNNPVNNNDLSNSSENFISSEVESTSSNSSKGNSSSSNLSSSSSEFSSSLSESSSSSLLYPRDTTIISERIISKEDFYAEYNVTNEQVLIAQKWLNIWDSVLYSIPDSIGLWDTVIDTTFGEVYEIENIAWCEIDKDSLMISTIETIQLNKRYKQMTLKDLEDNTLITLNEGWTTYNPQSYPWGEGIVTTEINCFNNKNPIRIKPICNASESSSITYSEKEGVNYPFFIYAALGESYTSAYYSYTINDDSEPCPT